MIEAENVLIGELGKAVEYVYPETSEKTITTNGEYNASDDSTYGYSKVTVDVQPPAPTLQSKETTPTTATQTITYDEGYDGLGQVQVNPIPSEYIIPTGTINITTNGTSDIKNYEYVDVNVQAIKDKPTYVSFYRCQDSTLNISWLDTTEITEMQYMFSQSKLTSIDLSNFVTTSVTNMSYMFQNCSQLTSLDLSNFNTSNVTNMQSMFAGCSKLTSLDLSNFNTSNVTNMQSMFQSDTKIKTLDLRNFTSVSGGTYTSMFTSCLGIETLYLNKFDFRNVSSIIGMLTNQLNKKCKIYVLDQYAKDALENLNFTNVEIAS